MRNIWSTCSSLFLSASLSASWTMVQQQVEPCPCLPTVHKILHSRKHLLSLLCPTKLSDFPRFSRNLYVTQAPPHGAGNIELEDDQGSGQAMKGWVSQLPHGTAWGCAGCNGRRAQFKTGFASQQLHCRVVEVSGQVVCGEKIRLGRDSQRGQTLRPAQNSLSSIRADACRPRRSVAFLSQESVGDVRG